MSRKAYARSFARKRPVTRVRRFRWQSPDSITNRAHGPENRPKIETALRRTIGFRPIGQNPVCNISLITLKVTLEQKPEETLRNAVSNVLTVLRRKAYAFPIGKKICFRLGPFFVSSVINFFFFFQIFQRGAKSESICASAKGICVMWGNPKMAGNSVSQGFHRFLLKGYSKR